jgi:hypothetical protein
VEDGDSKVSFTGKPQKLLISRIETKKEYTELSSYAVLTIYAKNNYTPKNVKCLKDGIPPFVDLETHVIETDTLYFLFTTVIRLVSPIGFQRWIPAESRAFRGKCESCDAAAGETSSRLRAAEPHSVRI